MGEPIVVTGATGNVGSEVVGLLRDAGHPVRVAVPDVDRARARFGDGVEYRQLVFGEPSTYRDAFAGAARVFLVRPPQIADVGRRVNPATDAAAAAGVTHAVFLSLQGAERNPLVPHFRIERHLRSSPMAWTFLRAAYFMQNLSTTHRDDVRLRDEISVPAGKGRTAFVDVGDIAAVAARALTEDGHAGRAYELTGPEALTYGQVAAILSGVLGRPIRYADPSPPAYWRRMRAAGHPSAFVLVTLGIYTAARLGLAAGVTDDVPRLLGRPAVTFPSFAAREADGWSRPGAPAG